MDRKRKESSSSCSGEGADEGDGDAPSLEVIFYSRLCSVFA